MDTKNPPLYELSYSPKALAAKMALTAPLHNPCFPLLFYSSHNITRLVLEHNNSITCLKIKVRGHSIVTCQVRPIVHAKFRSM